MGYNVKNIVDIKYISLNSYFFFKNLIIREYHGER